MIGTRSFEIKRPKRAKARIRKIPTLTEKYEKIKKSPALIGCNRKSIMVLIGVILFMVRIYWYYSTLGNFKLSLL